MNSQVHIEEQNSWNNTYADYPREHPLPYFLNKCAKENPGKVALKFHERQLTYADLYESSNKLAKLLIENSVKTGDVVGLAMDRSPEMVISLLAILKTGAAYVPLDPEYPKDRIEFMLEDSSASVLLTSKKYAWHFLSGAKEILIEDALNKLDAYGPGEPDVLFSSQELAYILYTSGSTGKPKGVQIRHYNLVNFLLSMQKQPGMTAEDKILAVTTISFDIAGLELYLPLICGAQLILSNSETSKDGRLLLDLVKDENISFMQATPYTWRMMLEAGWENYLPIKILCGGEALPRDLVNKLTWRSSALWNMYGPTETTVWSALKLIANDEDISIGKPIANTQVYILDDKFNNLINGTVGEIFIGGDGVALGYLNRPDLTAERFIDDPFSGIPGNKIYRTGDLGKINENGEIYCLGRIDHQVKVRGYRIELEEIEHVLSKQDDIKEAVVVAREDQPGDPRLVGYIVLKPGIDKVDLKTLTYNWQQALLAVLPEYMVPDNFVLLEAIPITPNGKTDRKSLPKPDYLLATAMGEFVAPRTDVEKLVAEVWQEIMGLPQISIFDNFFTIGGRSLAAVQIMARIEKLTGKRLPLATLFEHSTIEQLALRLNVDAKSITWESLVPIKPSGSKMPLYIVHGAGLNVLLFNALAMNMDDDQPVYGLQARGLNGIDEPLDVMENIAGNYIAEIINQNPEGPYALAGYSLGGTIAYEMARQMIAMGKDVKLLAVFDTYAKQSDKFDPFVKKIFNRVWLIIMQFLYSFVLFANDPKRTIEYKSTVIKRRIIRLFWKVKGTEEKREGFFAYDNEIDEASAKAKRNYYQKPLNITVDLFRAKKKTFYMADFKYLGWRKFALKGVNVHDIPGEHNTIFAPPHDKEFAVELAEMPRQGSQNQVMKVSIVTVNFNQPKVTEELLATIPANDDIEVIVVDNGSETDHTAEWQRKYPSIKFIRSERNLGFAGGNNIGINAAKGQYLFLVNNDTEFTPGLVEKLTAVLDGHFEVGMISPKINYFSNKNLIQYAGYTPLNFYTCRNSCIGLREEDKGQYDNYIGPTSYCHGSAMMVRKEAIEKAGLMNENFFLYYEELDWCEHIKRAGYQAWVCTEALIYHKESVSVGKKSRLKEYFMNRNRILFIRRNAPGLKKLVFYLYFLSVVVPRNVLNYVKAKNYNYIPTLFSAVWWNFTNKKNSKNLGYR